MDILLGLTGPDLFSKYRGYNRTDGSVHGMASVAGRFSTRVPRMLNEVTESIECDVLDDVLNTLRFRGSVFFRSRLAAPWGMALGASRNPRFHIALQGGFVIGSEERLVEAKPMDIVMLPGGNAHWIADRPHRRLIPSEQAGAACLLGEPLFQRGKTSNSLICGQVRHDDATAHPLLDALPSILHFQHIGNDDPVWQTVNLIDTELEKARHWQNPIVDRLSEVLFLQLLNRHAREAADTVGFVAGLRDRGLHRALSLVHRDPGYAWTLEDLAARSGMSRATLSRRFKRALGVSPMRYINDWRLLKAHHWVRYSGTSIERIADKVGFANARSLNKAFQRRFGVTPTRLRGRER